VGRDGDEGCGWGGRGDGTSGIPVSSGTSGHDPPKSGANIAIPRLTCSDRITTSNCVQCRYSMFGGMIFRHARGPCSGRSEATCRFRLGVGPISSRLSRAKPASSRNRGTKDKQIHIRQQCDSEVIRTNIDKGDLGSSKPGS